MKLNPIARSLISSAALLAISEASPLELDVLSVKRATPQAPNGYAPAPVDCPPTRPSIRAADSISPQEEAWLATRRQNTLQPMREFLTRLNITGFDVNGFFDSRQSNMSDIPNIGVAASGGGYRALMNGAGHLQAFDLRTPNSTNTGQLGGLLQSTTYLSGLSGGGWLVGSLYINNFTSITDILAQDTGNLWAFENSIFEGPDQSGIQLFNTAQYFDNIENTVQNKGDAGYNTSITDYWGRALSYQLVNASEGGPAYTFSSIADDAYFMEGNAPMPILVADGRRPGELLISANATNYEFNPWELGTFDPTVFGFAPLRYVGSRFVGGQLPDDERCIAGFDNAGFVMGTSSSLFNFGLLLANSTGLPGLLQDALNSVLTGISNDNDDIADWSPNPFYQYNDGINANANSTRLTLVDGGEDLQNIPLTPLIQPVRSVDVIFAIDSSADTEYNWPNGTAIIATYERSLSESGIANGTTFPAVPGANTFVNLGLNSRPTMFGCDASNQTGSPNPLIVYLPNRPLSFPSNFTTFQSEYDRPARDAAILNGYLGATQGNGSVDAQWPACVGCAIISRSLYRTGTSLPDICNQCFDRYCWNGTIAASEPPPYEPEPIFTPADSGAAGRMAFSYAAVLSVVAFGLANSV